MICSNLRSGNKEVDDYIEALENKVKSFSASNTKRLIRSIDGMAGKLADDLDMINESKQNGDGTEVELSSKFINSFLSLAEKADKIEKFSEIADKMYGVKTEETETITYTEETTTTTTEPEVNLFEVMQKKVKDKLHKNASS